MKFEITGNFIILFLLISFISGGVLMPSDKNVKGIIFFKTQMMDELKVFYTEEVGCDIWLEQGGCVILKAGNMLFGFCQRDKADMDALITFFYDTKEEVDLKYKKFKESALDKPVENLKYKIYHFFAKDPEGRMIEFQHFLHYVKKI